PPPPAPRVKIAVAQDAAFCFTYAENLALLSSLGCEIVPFSPIADASLPAGISGLYLPGGYPELHAQALSRNEAMREDIRRSIARSLPTIAECGGFLYLHERLDGVPMAGVLPGSAYRTPKLQRFGYVTLTAKRDNLLCRAGQSIRAHEFHYWDSDSCGEDFTACKASNAKSYDCIHASSSLWAGFPHLYFPANPGFAASFVKKAEAFSCHTGS
ncbi:MAG: cobyrinate a,c-diamide synthase, partial [Firmicutes bacterium]|nr:cobyrinate a,c-diamide synthase [Bacillota bacterium]